MSEYRQIVETKLGGVLYAGVHEPDGKACVLEAATIARGKPWSDFPGDAGLPDLRPLNDAFRDDAERTEQMILVVEALWDWPQWSEDHRRRFATRLAELMIRRVVPLALRATADVIPDHAEALRTAADRCETEGSASAARAAESAAESAARAALSAAASAVRAALSAAASAESAALSAAASAESAALSAAESAESAAESAERAESAAAWAAESAARAAESVVVLRVACTCWIDAARESAA